VRVGSGGVTVLVQPVSGSPAMLEGSEDREDEVNSCTDVHYTRNGVK
jgi:hypothetical protein